MVNEIGLAVSFSRDATYCFCTTGGKIACQSGAGPEQKNHPIVNPFTLCKLTL